MVHSPIWCKCKKQSWTRSYLRQCWEREVAARCTNTDCEREIEPDVIEELLQRIGVLDIEITNEEGEPAEES